MEYFKTDLQNCEHANRSTRAFLTFFLTCSRTQPLATPRSCDGFGESYNAVASLWKRDVNLPGGGISNLWIAGAAHPI